jgi:Tol biopolymer transport system component
VKRDGTRSRKILTVAGWASYLRFAPDGRSFRFTVKDEAHRSTSLWEASADGTNLRAVLPGWNKPAAECCGNWTSDGRYFVFQSEHNGRKDVWAIPETTDFLRGKRIGPVQLTAGPMNFSDPIPTKDGKRVFAIGVLPRAEVVRYDLRTHEFVPYLSDISAEGLDFSRSGEWVTYTSYPEGALWRSKVDGSERRQLTFPPLRAFLPRWSPDGKQIAFMATSPGKEWKINIVQADGGTPQQLLSDEQDESDPTWSPDGNSIAFGRGPWTQSSELDIRVLDLHTHQVSKIIRSDGLFSPRWSPDGRYIAALRLKTPMTPMLFDFKTREWQQLLSTNMGSPSWSRGGKYLYLQDWSTPNDRMVRLRLSGRKLERIAAFESIGGLGLGTIIAWTGLTPDDSPLLARDVSAQEIYALEWPAP